MKPIKRSAFRGDSGAVAERPGIGLYGETSLHDALKRAYACPGDLFEASVDGSVIDVVRADGELVEVQTSSLRALKPKLEALCRTHRVRIVHPVIALKTIIHIDAGSGIEKPGRKSPKRGDLWSAFDELVKAAWIPCLRNLSLELVFVSVRETWVNDGQGSWRRKGSRVRDRELEAILDTRVFSKRSDWMSLVPRELPPPWSSETLGTALGIPAPRARKVLYVLAKAGFLADGGKSGSWKLYVPVPARLISPWRAPRRPDRRIP
ncbi:MAG: hypothetical protein NT080_04420 [Spirochaetes bacterium]|nr:hypothetical protein [Spirochaetota bacterium]